MLPKEVFLSHSSQNIEIAMEVAGTIQNQGVPLWFSDENILTAQDWLDAIGKALERCDWFMVLLSPASVISRWVRLEYSYAIRHNQYIDHIVPVIIEPCDYEALSWTIGAFQMANLYDNKIAAYTKILRAWGIEFDNTLMV